MTQWKHLRPASCNHLFQNCGICLFSQPTQLQSYINSWDPLQNYSYHTGYSFQAGSWEFYLTSVPCCFHFMSWPGTCPSVLGDSRHPIKTCLEVAHRPVSKPTLICRQETQWEWFWQRLWAIPKMRIMIKLHRAGARWLQSSLQILVSTKPKCLESRVCIMN